MTAGSSSRRPSRRSRSAPTGCPARARRSASGSSAMGTSPSSAFTCQSARSRGRVRAARGRPRVGYRLTEDDVQAIRYGIARAADIHFAAGAVEVYPQLGRPAGRSGRGEGSAPIERAKVRARDLRLEAFHPMGTARMGADPASSVVSPAGEAHDLAGPLRRRRVHLPDVAAGQPDDHDHGAARAGSPRPGRALELIGAADVDSARCSGGEYAIARIAPRGGNGPNAEGPASEARKVT